MDNTRKDADNRVLDQFLQILMDHKVDLPDEVKRKLQRVSGGTSGGELEDVLPDSASMSDAPIDKEPERHDIQTSPSLVEKARQKAKQMVEKIPLYIKSHWGSIAVTTTIVVAVLQYYFKLRDREMNVQIAEIRQSAEELERSLSRKLETQVEKIEESLVKQFAEKSDADLLAHYAVAPSLESYDSPERAKELAYRALEDPEQLHSLNAAHAMCFVKRDDSFTRQPLKDKFCQLLLKDLEYAFDPMKSSASDTHRQQLVSVVFANGYHESAFERIQKLLNTRVTEKTRSGSYTMLWERLEDFKDNVPADILRAQYLTGVDAISLESPALVGCCKGYLTLFESKAGDLLTRIAARYDHGNGHQSPTRLTADLFGPLVAFQGTTGIVDLRDRWLDAFYCSDAVSLHVSFQNGAPILRWRIKLEDQRETIDTPAALHSILSNASLTALTLSLAIDRPSRERTLARVVSPLLSMEKGFQTRHGFQACYEAKRLDVRQSSANVVYVVSVSAAGAECTCASGEDFNNREHIKTADLDFVKWLTLEEFEDRRIASVTP